MCFLTVDTAADNAEMPPALAFGSRSSVFKEQPRTEPSGGRGARPWSSPKSWPAVRAVSVARSPFGRTSNT